MIGLNLLSPMVIVKSVRPFIDIYICLPRKHQAVVYSSIQTKVFPAIPENILLAVITDR
jgi:hypothetical protein